MKVFFKCESWQRTGSFKFRGALNAVRAVKRRHPHETDLVTVSSGNFAAALALASRLEGLTATIVMPSNTTEIKVRAVRDYGADVVFCDPARRDETCREVAEARKARVIHPSEDFDVICGQGTIYEEFVQQVRERWGATLEAAVVPVGGGGVISGIAVAASREGGKTRVLGGEPELADDAFRSKRSETLEGHRNGVVPSTVAEGLRTTLGPHTFDVVVRRGLVEAIQTVSEREIVEATLLLAQRLKVLVEPSSAVAYAALKKLLPVVCSRAGEGEEEVCVGVVLTGGNIDPISYARLAEGGKL